jgi:hypothetical protein
VATRCALYGKVGVWPNPGPGYPGRLAASNFSADMNVYFAAPGAAPLRFPRNTSLAAWRAASGNDGASVAGDPLLRDPARGDFAVLPGSPAWTLGWRAIDTSGVGPRP